MKSKLSKKAAVRKGKTIQLGSTSARATANLGNGFRRTVFTPIQINPNSFLTIRFSAGSGRVVINAGWNITEFLSAWPTDSFPDADNRWTLIIENPTNSTRFVTPYLITKRR